ncbi:hypothetical protein BYT27DRAFT_7227440 [Phlegmacium glaucopus]|nr:hypothetical protein BYT27DRAFT_7227440 [Phlegmacium glaucopus]
MSTRKVGSLEEDDSQDSEAPPSKKVKTSTVVVQARAPQCKRTVTDKQSALDQNAANASDKKVENLKKKLAKAKQDAKKVKQPTSQLLNSDKDEYESEEKDSDDFPGFRTSITQLPSVKITSKPNQSTKLRLTNPMMHLSNRTFLKVPHELTSATPEPTNCESSLSRHTSPSSTGYAGDGLPSGSSLYNSESQHASLPAPATQSSKRSLPVAELLEGVVTSRRPKALDYVDIVNTLLVRTMFDYEGLASKDADEFYELSDRMCNLVKKRGSRICGHVLAIVRPQIIAIYSFNRKVTPQAKTRNRTLCETLLENRAFHYKNKIISEIIYLAWFEDKTSQGPLLPHYFNPIPIETLAFILTVIDFCLQEWSTGTFIQAKFFKKDVLASHKAYRLEVEAWSALNPSVIENIRKKLFNRALRSAGVVNATLTIPSCLQETIKDRVQMELDGRTRETDSEVSDM